MHCMHCNLNSVAFHYLVWNDEAVSPRPAEVLDDPGLLLLQDPPADGVAPVPPGDDDVRDGVVAALVQAQVQVVVGAGEASLAARAGRGQWKLQGELNTEEVR